MSKVKVSHPCDTNGKAAELFNILNHLVLVPNSKREYAVARTLRNMKAWQTAYADAIKDIDEEEMLYEKNDAGNLIAVKTTLTRTIKDKKTGEDVTEQYQIPTYSKEGEKKRLKRKRDLNDAPLLVSFDIHSTDDGVGLSTYEQITLEELGFYTPPKTKSDDH